MKPLPKLRKTIKWGGAAMTALLALASPVSNWWLIGWNPSGYLSLSVARGAVHITRVVPPGPSPVPTHAAAAPSTPPTAVAPGGQLLIAPAEPVSIDGHRVVRPGSDDANMAALDLAVAAKVPIENLNNARAVPRSDDPGPPFSPGFRCGQVPPSWSRPFAWWWSWGAHGRASARGLYVWESDPSFWTLNLLLWPLALMSGAAALCAWRCDLLATRRMHVAAGRCAKCGYDKSSLPGKAPCPECGNTPP